MKRFAALADLGSAVGQRLGTSDWHGITQEMVDRFAENTGDRQWIHVDPDRCAAGPFGAPVAHGYLTLALVPGLMTKVFRIDGVGLVLNKELHRLRFFAPVRVGDRVRTSVDLISARPRPRDYWEASFRVVAEIENTEAPAFTVETVFLYQQS